MSHRFHRDPMADGYRASFEEPMVWPPPSLDDHGRPSKLLGSSGILSKMNGDSLNTTVDNERFSGNDEPGSSSHRAGRADNREDLMALGLDVNQDDDLGDLLSQLTKYSSDYHRDESEPTPSVSSVSKQQQQTHPAQVPQYTPTPSKKPTAFERQTVSNADEARRADKVPVRSRAAPAVDDESPLIEEGELQAILEQLSSSGVDLERTLQDPIGRQRLLQSIMEQQQRKKSPASRAPESRLLAGGRDGPSASFPSYSSTSTTVPVLQPPPMGDQAWYEATRVFQEQLERSRVVPPPVRKRERSSSNSSSDSRGKHRRSKHEAKAKKKKKDKEEKVKRKKQKEAADDAKKLLQQRKDEEKALTAQIAELNGKKELLMKRSDLLKEELGRLQRQYNELCRKMQRVKEGHKAPLLQENLRLQGEIEKQMSGITNTVTEMDKVLSNAAARLNKLKKQLEESEKEKSANKASSSKEKVNASEVAKALTVEKTEAPVWYEYFDAGSHWCQVCNVIVASLFDMLTHIHTVAHKAKLDVKDAPWMPERVRDPSKRPLPPFGMPTRVIPIKGVEFLLPSNAFYCTLCSEFAGDPACAEDHLKSETHRMSYERLKNEQPLYERTYNMDKAASMTKRTQMAAANTVKQEAFEEGLHLVQRNTMANKKLPPSMVNNDPPARILAGMDKFQMKIGHPMTANKATTLTTQKSLPKTMQLKDQVLIPRHVAEKVLLRQKLDPIAVVDAVRKRSHSPKPSRPPISTYHRNRSRSRSASRRSRSRSRSRRRRFSHSRSPSPRHQRRLHERSRSRERRPPSPPPRPPFFGQPRGRTFVINSSGPATKTKTVGVKSEAVTLAEAKNRQYQSCATVEDKALIAKCHKKKPQGPTKNVMVAKKTTAIAPVEFMASFRSKESITGQKGGKSAISRKTRPAVVNDVDVHTNGSAISYGPALPTDLVPANDDTGANGDDVRGEIRNLVSCIVDQVGLTEAVH